MYHNLFDYKAEYEFYDKILKRNKSKSVLEIGCGSGNLASYFEKSEYEYTGIDSSKEMLTIANEVAPNAKFIRADMRKLRLKLKYDTVIISGRSISYLITNNDVKNTLKSIYQTLKKGGVLIFDSFNAAKIISQKKKRFVQEAAFNRRKYKRVSTKTLNLKSGWTENWHATYYIKEKNKKTKIIKDKSIIRSFTKDEMKLFLKIFEFRVEKVIDRGPTFTIIAKK